MHPEYNVSRIKVFDELQRWDSASSCSCPGRRCRRHRSPPPFPRRSGPATQMPEIHGKFVVKIVSELTAIPCQSMPSLFDALRVATSSLVPWLEAHRLQTPLQHDIWRPRKKRTATHGWEKNSRTLGVFILLHYWLGCVAQRMSNIQKYETILLWFPVNTLSEDILKLWH